jgi:serine protease Do
MTARLPRRTAVALVSAALPARARSAPESFAPLVRRVMPSVVNIAVTETVGGAPSRNNLPPEVERQLRDLFRQRRREVSSDGSGFIIDPAGFIVTNAHVVAGASRIVVALSDRTQVVARLVGADDLTDVAVIKIDPPGPLQAVTLGSTATLEPGDWVLAAGNPFGLGASISAGIISARGRDIGSGPFDDYLQTDAPINPGNSGGPLFDTEGRVVGMNTAIFSPTGTSVGIGFAIPVELVARIADELRAKGRIDRGWLGVSLTDVEASPRNPGGVGIAGVEPRGPAARAGLRPGDIVTGVNGESVETSRALIRAVAAVPPGTKLQLAVRRQNSKLDLTVTVGRRPRSEEN